jgi:hypothetical protein
MRASCANCLWNVLLLAVSVSSLLKVRWFGGHALIHPILVCGYMVGALFNSLLYVFLRAYRLAGFLAIYVN